MAYKKNNPILRGKNIYTKIDTIVKKEYIDTIQNEELIIILRSMRDYCSDFMRYLTKNEIEKESINSVAETVDIAEAFMFTCDELTCLYEYPNVWTIYLYYLSLYCELSRNVEEGIDSVCDSVIETVNSKIN